MRTIKHACTLDCWDCCSLKVTVDGGRVVKIEGDRDHPYTKGFICKKGRMHLDRLYSAKRLRKPLLRTEEGFKEISFEQALDIMAQKMEYYREKYGSQSIFHFEQSGSGGVSKAMEEVFFNFIGGITESKGSTCWGAGIKAQEYDFGNVKGHYLDDMYNSKLVIVWGRNPHSTSIHLMASLQEAMKRGIKVMVIDPIRTETAKRADTFIQIRPSSDIALAMAMSRIIIEEGLEDREFIENYTYGFETYKEYLLSLDKSRLAKATGLAIDEIKSFAIEYASARPATIYPGYGLQKYKNGVNTIRAIDALAAICGYIGCEGGGVNYANRLYPDILDLDPYGSAEHAGNARSFMLKDFSNALEEIQDPPVKMVVVSKANPMNQLPDLERAQQAFSNVEFKVTFDMFMTDTASLSDLVIPCSNTLETEDIVYSSMNNPYISFNEKAAEPGHILMDEYCFFRELARKLGIEGYPMVDKLEYIEKVLKPLEKHGHTLEDIRNGYVTIKGLSVAWKDKLFQTPSGRYEFVSEKAEVNGLSAHPEYMEVKDEPGLRLLTPHAKDSLFSQHFFDVEGIAKALVNPSELIKRGIVSGETVRLVSNYGNITVQIFESEDAPEGIVYMNIGWHKSHGNPNFLTSSCSSERGEQLAYYESFVEIKKANKRQRP